MRKLPQRGEVTYLRSHSTLMQGVDQWFSPGHSLSGLQGLTGLAAAGVGGRVSQRVKGGEGTVPSRSLAPPQWAA